MFHNTQHIDTTNPITIVLVYKYIPFFQHKFTLFLENWGGLSVRCTSCDNPGY